MLAVCAICDVMELTQMPLLEVLAAVGRWCGVAQCVFAARREHFACSDILPLVQPFIPRPTEFKML